MIHRILSFVAGAGLLGSAAHVTIATTGGYTQAHAVMTIAIAVGVGIAALTIGSAWTNQRRALAVWLLVAIVAGEAFGALMTAERLVVGREAQQAPLRAADGDRKAAAGRVARAEKALREVPTTSRELDEALKVKAAADGAAVSKSAEMGCRDNCRQLLQAQVSSAEREVGAARAALAAVAAAAHDELERARLAFASIKQPPSATPLADRLHVPAWAIDLFTSALGSMAANGLGCGLLVFAAHWRKEEKKEEEESRAEVLEPVVVQPPATLRLESSDQQAQGAVTKFLLDTMVKEPSAETDVAEAFPIYAEWCRVRGMVPIAEDRFATQFERVCTMTGVKTTDDPAGRTFAHGVKLIAA